MFLFLLLQRVKNYAPFFLVPRRVHINSMLMTKPLYAKFLICRLNIFNINFDFFLVLVLVNWVFVFRNVLISYKFSNLLIIFYVFNMYRFDIIYSLVPLIFLFFSFFLSLRVYELLSVCFFFPKIKFQLRLLWVCFLLLTFSLIFYFLFFFVFFLLNLLFF